MIRVLPFRLVHTTVLEEPDGSPSVFIISRRIISEDGPTVEEFNDIDEVHAVISQIAQALIFVPFKLH
jgi:hypothetical protein